MKHRKFISVGEPIPKIEMKSHADFILNYQKSILLALVKRKLITLSQCEECIDKLEKRIVKKRGS